MISRPTTFFNIYKISFISKRYLKRNPRCVTKFVITLALKLKFSLPILPVYQVKLVLLIFVKIVLLHRLMYHFIIDNVKIQIIDKAEGVK